MEDHTSRLVEHAPAALPGKHSEVCIFQIEGTQQLIEPAKLQKLPAVECTGTATGVEAGVQIPDCLVFAMANSQLPAGPPCLGKTSLFPLLVRVIEKDLARNSEYGLIPKTIEQRLEKIGRDAHVAVQQNNDVVACLPKARV